MNKLLKKEVPHRVKELQDSYDEIFQEIVEGEPLYYYDWILDLLDVKRGRKILDVGCGGGFLLRAAEKRDSACSWN